MNSINSDRVLFIFVLVLKTVTKISSSFSKFYTQLPRILSRGHFNHVIYSIPYQIRVLRALIPIFNFNSTPLPSLHQFLQQPMLWFQSNKSKKTEPVYLLTQSQIHDSFILTCQIPDIITQLLLQIWNHITQPLIFTTDVNTLC